MQGAGTQVCGILINSKQRSMAAEDCLIKGGMLLDPTSDASRRSDILIEGGRIAAIAKSLEPNGVCVFDATGRYISPGWMDMHVHLREPGFEHKETIASGCRAAAWGGFTAVACMPNTSPPADAVEVLQTIHERARGLPVDVFPIACVSQGRAGAALAPMCELAAQGAVAFSDDGSPVQSGRLMRCALEYASMLGRPIINHMEDLSMGVKGYMNEGEVSTRLGVMPVPALSEESMVARDLMLADYTGAHLHVAHLSTAESVAMVRRAKARGVNVTSEVCTHHFALTDVAVEESGFATSTKMHPPLRTAADIEMIKKGLRDDTIDAICTDHAPHAAFEKEVAFADAPFGIIGLETAWGLTGRHIIAEGHLSVAAAVHKLAVAPRQILRIPVPRIAEGERANLTVFDATTAWTFEARHIRSKSANTPFIGAPMIGKAWAVYNNGQLIVNAE